MFGFFKESLKKTIDVIKEIVPDKKESISKDILEEVLLEADVEYELVEKILEPLPSLVKREELEKALLSLFVDNPNYELSEIYTKPFVELIIGVNGAGKTTTIAKLCSHYKKLGENVILGAGDTFRAAAIEQLKRWSDRVDVPIVFTKQGHDPSAVVYDTIKSALSKKLDRVIIDTAGRLHTQVNLSNELKKIVKVAKKAKPSAPDRKILIIDGTQGNSAITQAVAFNEMVGIDAIIITKLDGTAKGGAVFSISNSLNLPILYIGVGEGVDDLIEFNKNEFVASLLDEIYIKDVKEEK